MIVLNSLDNIYSDAKTAVAIGKFDGVHAGHRKLLSVIREAKKDALCPCVFTFVPSAERLFGFGDCKVLSTDAEKRRLLEQMGVELLVEYPMDKETASIEPELFVREFLQRRLKAGLVAAGADLSFGGGGKGDFALLNALRRDCGYETKEVEKLNRGGSVVSSSRVRALIMEGKMEEAADCLDQPYSLCGEVSHGAHLGHSLGFPTMNLYPSEEKLLPPFGVYRSRIRLNGNAYEGLSNIGIKPTVSRESRVGVESWLYDFERDAYGEEICVELLHFVRPEQRFESLDALKAQLAKDREENRPKP